MNCRQMFTKGHILIKKWKLWQSDHFVPVHSRMTAPSEEVAWSSSQPSIEQQIIAFPNGLNKVDVLVIELLVGEL